DPRQLVRVVVDRAVVVQQTDSATAVRRLDQPAATHGGHGWGRYLLPEVDAPRVRVEPTPGGPLLHLTVGRRPDADAFLTVRTVHDVDVDGGREYLGPVLDPGDEAVHLVGRGGDQNVVFHLA